MGRFQTNLELVFQGSDLNKPRMAVEKEKIALHFPNFKFYGDGVRVTSVKGYLKTNMGKRYYVKIDVPYNYPYEIPKIYLPYNKIDPDCRHTFKAGNICVMKSEQWTSTFSLSFLVAKTALWLNKYDTWILNGKTRWPGKNQHR